MLIAMEGPQVLSREEKVRAGFARGRDFIFRGFRAYRKCNV